MASQLLAGTRLLIVEDEYYLADDARTIFPTPALRFLGRWQRSRAHVI